MRPGSLTGLARWTVAVTACGLTLLAAGCGSSGTSPGNAAPSVASSPVPSAQDSALCAAADALRAALNKLTHVTAGPNAANQITADLNEVKTALTNFADQAGNQWQAQIASLNGALGKLKTAISDVTASPSTQAVSAAADALREVTTAAQDLLAKVKSKCPSATSSPSM